MDKHSTTRLKNYDTELNQRAIVNGDAYDVD